MLQRTLIFLILISACSAFAVEDQVRLRTEFPGETPYYEIRHSVYNHEYFVMGPGPCSCASGGRVVQCSTNVQRDLKEKLKNRAALESEKCAPDAGCRPGHEVIYAQCLPQPVQKKKHR